MFLPSETVLDFFAIPGIVPESFYIWIPICDIRRIKRFERSLPLCAIPFAPRPVIQGKCCKKYIPEDQEKDCHSHGFVLHSFLVFVRCIAPGFFLPLSDLPIGERRFIFRSSVYTGILLSGYQKRAAPWPHGLCKTQSLLYEDLRTIRDISRNRRGKKYAAPRILCKVGL